ncbi:pectinesterase-like [Salvia hispanica]|uniref:pectinesterase-like n=1 Tax=Salvia hispanica TaxID=49212 RepID=UPI002009BD7B|nr:pectinesterase-like [Salvia hispanica]
MGDPSSKKKVIIAAVASVLLVGAIVAVVLTTRGSSEEAHPEVESTTKAVDSICAPTRFQETCHASLEGVNTTDPKKLIEAAIDVAIKKVGHALSESSILKEAATDPMTKGAYEVCREVLEKAVWDLERAVDKISSFDGSNMKAFVADLRSWMSAVITDQETCIDGFQNTKGETGEKMKNLLKTARELSSNGLAMVTDISEFLETLQLGDLLGGGDSDGATTGNSRKLMAEEAESEGDAFVTRRLLQATAFQTKPTIVVAKDGSGKFKSITDAVQSIAKTIPAHTKKKGDNGAFLVILIKPGVYAENVDIPWGLDKLVLIGGGPSTKITGQKSVKGGVQSYATATLAVNGDDFVAKDLTVENTAGPEGLQALAVRLSGDRAVLYNVRMDGYQDTLCADVHRQYFRNCIISGTIDYIFGSGLALYQDCTFITRKPIPGQECVAVAHGRSDPKSGTAVIIQNSKFIAEPGLLQVKPPVQAFLGRPWKKLARTIIMNSQIDGFINETGWAKWIEDIGIDTCFYVEYGNKGPGSNVAKRVKWKGIQTLNGQQIQSWTGAKAFGDDSWIKASGAPYNPN